MSADTEIGEADATTARDTVAADRPALVRQMARAFLTVAAFTCLAGSLMLVVGLGESPLDLPMSIWYGGLGVGCVAASRSRPPWLGRWLTLLFVLIALSLALSAAVRGWGAAAPALAVLGLMVCLLCAAAGWRSGLLLATVCVAAVIAVAAVPLPVPPVVPATALQLVTQLISILAGLGGGAMIWKVVARYMGAANERERRFRSLLALATDAYWELDVHNRLVEISDNRHDKRPLGIARAVGVPPWESSQFVCDAETLDRLQAELESRVPFRDQPVGWIDRNGRHLAFLVSGEPRFDERGVFKGYWGVARDVTAVNAARAALAATETRYQDLFTRIPTPLVLHRGGRIIDANPSAVTMFGHRDLSTMVGSDMFDALEPGDSRDRSRRRVETLQGQPIGTALPVADFTMLVQGRRIAVRATGVRVDAEGGPAVLAIFVDESERLAAEQAVRRSEAMLSHLVATTPDLITLTEMATGRYAMVNHAFERVTGWTAAEVVGRTAVETGIWTSREVRDRFVATVMEKGSVANVPLQAGTKSGATVSMLVSAARFVMDGRDYMVINGRDVTDSERDRLERAAILANASIGIAVTRGRRFVLANRHFETIFGWQPDELIGQPGRVVWISEADHAEVHRLLGPALLQGEPVEIERSARRKDGSTFVARVRARRIDPGRPDSGTVWIVEDVTERRQFEQALARARDDAEAASRAKSAFLANTSHELRTPLNGMIGLARLARAPDTAEPQRLQYLDQIAETAQSLAGIISDILDLSKIEAGKLQVETTVFDLGELLQALQRTYSTLAEARGLELHLDVADGAGGTVSGDPLRLRQIITNFLANALKFTAAGHVRLVATRPDGGPDVRFEVSDTGPGIAESARGRLFKPFTQADESTTRRYGGTGLGLSICRELATLMGGEVGVGDAPSDGSVFWAQLPLPRATRVEPTAIADDPRGLNGTRVLMAEDNAVNMMIAVAMLERWGVEVAQASDGREAVTAVQSADAAGRPFDAVLMDVQMPVMSGHEATRTLRRCAAGRVLPIIALTAAALVSERNDALAAGMDDFLTKPIDAEKLRRTLLRWCGRTAARGVDGRPAAAMGPTAGATPADR